MPRSYGRQRVLQIGDQIVRALDSYRKADHLLGHPHLLALFWRDHEVRGEHRDRYQRLDSTQAGGQREQTQRLADPAGIVACAFDFEGHHAATARHLLARHRVLRMALQERIVYASHLRVLRKELRHAQRILVLPRHPHCQRLQAAHQHPRGMRVHAIAERRAGGENLGRSIQRVRRRRRK